MHLHIVSMALMEVVCGIALKDFDCHSSKRSMEQMPPTNSRAAVEDSGRAKTTPVAEMNPQFWRTLADRELEKRLTETYNYKKAKNVIFFVGDGMSLTTATAARIRQGQLNGKTGEEDALSFEKFPHTGLVRTYCTNGQVPDSACTATAYLCGVKTNLVTLGVSPNVPYNNCSMSMNPDNHLSSIADWAHSAGKSTGFITTTTLTHASPAGLYAKAASRFWESDADIPEKIRQQGPCMDIAQQLIKHAPGRNLDVLMGGGMGKFLPNTVVDAHGQRGERLDGYNLLQLWKDMHPRGALVSNRDELLNVNVSKVSHIMGLFQSKVMDYHTTADGQRQPTLAEMTKVALEFLSRNSRGYFIFIEGGLIDYGHHLNRPHISLDETLEMAKAVQLAVNMTNQDDTLIVVSADHAHPLTISGYPERGTNILGLNNNDVDSNGIKYATLNYAIGPQQYLDAKGQRINLEELIAQEETFVHPSQIPGLIGVHAGDDVAVYARGPYAHLFRGLMQQHTLPHAMAYAACIGEGPKMSDDV